MAPRVGPWMARCAALLTILGTVPAAMAAAVTREATYHVVNVTNVTYAQGLQCTDDTYNNCTPKNLLLDIYRPQAALGSGPLSPALVLAHGGGNSGGDRRQNCFMQTAAYFASRGYVAFNIDYRLAGDKGKVPKQPTPQEPGVHPGAPLITGPRTSAFPKGSCLAVHPFPPQDTERRGPYNGPLYVQFNASSRLCISPENGAAAGGVTLILDVCSGTEEQAFHRDHNNIQSQRIVHRVSGLCIALAAGSGARKNTTTLALQACDASEAAQSWVLGDAGVLFYKDPTHGDTCATTAKALSAEALGWAPKWASGYPAVRDLKAAIRFVRATAATYGVDPTKVAVSGGSAGATNSLAAGVVFEDDYKMELSAAEDPTLQTTHLQESSAVQCVYTHWSSHGEVDLVTNYDPLNRTRWGQSNAPVIEFHGAVDTTIPISQAYQTWAEYNKTGVPYQLHVMPKVCPSL